MDYLKKIAFDDSRQSTQSSANCRNDIFMIKTFSDKEPRKVILNKNKLQSIYK